MKIERMPRPRKRCIDGEWAERFVALFDWGGESLMYESLDKCVNENPDAERIVSTWIAWNTIYQIKFLR